MNMNKYLDIAPEVQQALADGRPVVALESTIISHGMPYPKNVETALLVEQTLRDNGAVPATIAILGGPPGRPACPRRRSLTSARLGARSPRSPAATCRSSARAARTAPPPSPRR